MQRSRLLNTHHPLLLFVSLAILAMVATGALRATAPSASPVQVGQVEPTPTPEPLSPQSYYNAREGFSLILPPGWTLSETGKRRPAVNIQSTLPDQFVNAKIFAYTLTEPLPLKDWLMAEVEDHAAGVAQVSEGIKVQLGKDTSGYFVLLDWAASTGIGIQEHWTGVMRGTQAFLIQVITLSPGPELLDAIKAFSSSFTLEERDPQAAYGLESLSLYAGQILTLDPALYRGSSSGIPPAIFSGLVALDRDLNVVPDIVEGWTLSGLGRVYTFHLRPNVAFHDGRPLTAHDFKYSWERATNPDTESPTARTYLGDIVGAKAMLDGEATELSGVEVVDDLTLQVTIDLPKPYFLQKLAYPAAFVVDRTNVESGEDWADRPNGTGPFKLIGWRKDELLVLERHLGYYGEVAKLYQIVYRIFGGRPMMMYERGDIDITGVPIFETERAIDPTNPLSSELVVGNEFCTRYLAFNVSIPPFDDPDVRHAFALALDVDKMVAITLRGTADRAAGIVPPGMAGHNPSLRPVPFDPAQARELLDGSKYGGAENLPPVISFARHSAMHWMWREYLGVEVEAVSLPERQDFFDRLDARELPLWVSTWCADYPDPQNFLEVLFHSDSDENDFGYSNPDVDALLYRAAFEPVPNARMALYRDVEKLVLGDWVAVPLWHSREYTLVKPHVSGYESAPIGLPYLKEIFIDR